jgi:riboflavin synthase
MFTGLVEARGTLAARSGRGRGARVTIGCALADLVLGESIAVDGVCITVETIVKGGFEADLSFETLEKTTLGALDVGAGVNLERALPAGGRLGGHIVSGHVDGVARVKEKSPVDAAVKVTFEVGAELAPFLAPKGSVAVNGVSLTINNASRSAFDVVLVPHTQAVTKLHELAVGAPVNVEVDVLARYCARLLAFAGPGSGSGDEAWMTRLRNAGYL